MLSQKKTNINCCITALAVYLLLFNASYYLHNHTTAFGARYRRSACGHVGHVEACGSGLMPHGLNFRTAWCTMRQISVEKDWKCVLTQKVVTLNTFCDIACLTFQLPHITTGSFQSHRWQPTSVSSKSPTLKERNKRSVICKSFAITSYCFNIFTWGGQVGYSYFSSEIT